MENTVISLKLETGCKRAFLEQCMRLIWKRKAHSQEYLKQLFISVPFLNTYQTFPISCLTIGFCINEICLVGCLPFKELFAGNFDTFTNYKIKTLTYVTTYRKIYNLLSLLKPTHFYIFVYQPSWPIKTAKKCIQLFGLVDGKIALSLDKKMTRSSQLIFNYLAAREIGVLCCAPEILTNPRLTSPLTLDKCEICEYINKVQLTEILRHNFKFLLLTLDDEFIDETSQSEISSVNSSMTYTCTSLTQLRVKCEDCSESFMRLLDFVKDRCPNLEGIFLKIEWTSHKWSSGLFAMVKNTDSIVAQFLEIQRKVQEIMIKCTPPIIKLKIESCASILYYGASEEFNCNWIEDVKKLSLFKNAKHHHLGTEKICRLEVKLDESFLDLRITLQIHYELPKTD